MDCGLNLPCIQVADEDKKDALAIYNDGNAPAIFGYNRVTKLRKYTGGSAGSGVVGRATADFAAGVYGLNLEFGAGVSGHGYTGVEGKGQFGVVGGSNDGVGVKGSVQSGVGVMGSATTGTGIGVMGLGDPSKAGQFYGDVDVNGDLTKSGGGFKIDHPADPANKYLCHSFVESPDRKNVYDGVVVLNPQGEAKVALPPWFEGLNRDFRYQLTAMGSSGPDLHIAQGISKNAFWIAGGKPRMKVSWQVTGIRKDRWAASNPVQVEEKKSVRERGHYRHPEVHGHAQEKSILWARHPDLMRRMKAAKARPKKGGSKRPV